MENSCDFFHKTWRLYWRRPSISWWGSSKVFLFFLKDIFEVLIENFGCVDCCLTDRDVKEHAIMYRCLLLEGWETMSV